MTDTKKAAPTGGHSLDKSIISESQIKREIESFIRELHGEDREGYFNLSMIDHDTGQWSPSKFLPADDEVTIAHKCMELEQQYPNRSLYYGVMLYKTSENREGNNAISVPGVFLDLDTKEGKHKQKRLPENRTAAYALLMEIMQSVATGDDDECIMSPTFIIDTGSGYHAYWLFDEPFTIKNEQDRSFIRKVMKEFEAAFNLIVDKKYDYKFDTVCELGRVLRLPSVFNRKYGCRTKYIKEIEQGDRYTVNEIQEVTRRMQSALSKTEMPQHTKQEQKKVPFIKETDPEQVCNECAFMKHWRDDADKLSEPEWWAGISVLARDDVKDHKEFIHQYSALYPRYTHQQTEQKIKETSARSGPMTCEKIRSDIGGTYCNGCKYMDGKIKSPVTLGAIPIERLHAAEVMDIKQLNDSGNADRIMAEYGENLMYNHDNGEWFYWNGLHWARDTKNRILELPEKMARKHLAQVELMDPELMGSKEDRKELAKKKNTLMTFFNKSLNASTMKNALELVAARYGVAVNTHELDPVVHTHLLPVVNGTINLKTGSLEEHRREHRFTKLVNVTYDPAAKCETWLKFLARICRDGEGNTDPEELDYLQRAIGYTLSGDMHEQAFFILYGSGGNGKSTFINVIRHLLGPFAKQANTSTFSVQKNKKSAEATPDLAKLYGVRFVVVSEPDEGMELAEGLIKQWTGGEEIAARYLHKNEFEFFPVGKLWLNTNHLPRIKGGDLGIERRIRVLPFTSRIEKDEQDPYLEARLMEELPGILNWAIEGYKQLAKNGLSNMPKRAQELTQTYLSDHDTISKFIMECCELGGRERIYASNNDLYERYKEWLHDAYPVAPTKFFRTLTNRCERMGYPLKDHRTNQSRGYYNIRLLPVPPKYEAAGELQRQYETKRGLYPVK